MNGVSTETARRPREWFVEAVRRMQLTYCPTCRPCPYTDEEAEGLLHLLRTRPGRWFTCSCGVRWMTRRNWFRVRLPDEVAA